MNLRYNLVIFDFHGTMTEHVLRTIKSYHAAGQEVWGKGFDKSFYQGVFTRPAQSSGEGMSHRDFIRHQFNWQDTEELNRFNETFTSSMNRTYIPVPGLRRTCSDLTAMGVEMAILTDGNDIKEIEEKLIRWGLGYLFPRIYSSHKTGVKKPNKETIGFILFYGTLRDKELVSPAKKH